MTLGLCAVTRAAFSSAVGPGSGCRPGCGRMSHAGQHARPSPWAHAVTARLQRLRAAWAPPPVGSQPAEDPRLPAPSGEELASHASSNAAAAALDADNLLLDDAAQRLHAQVSDELPFGIPPARRPGGGLVVDSFTRGVGYLLAAGLAAAVLIMASQLMLVVVAAFIAIGMEPVVDWLEGKGVRRYIAVALIVFSALGGLVAFLAAAIPPLSREASQLIDNAPRYLQQLQDQHSTIGRLADSLHLQPRLRALAETQFSVNSLNGLLDLSRTALSYAFQLLIIVVLVIYFLVDFPAIKRAVYRLAPLQQRPRIGLLGDAIISRTGGYLLGNVLTSMVATAAQFVALRLLGVPFALVLSVLVGVLDLVPLIGSTIAGVVVTAVALAVVSPTAAIINIVFTIIYRIFEDYVLSPRILRRTVNVRPVVTIMAVLLGGALLGIEGAVIAVPVAAAIQLVVTEVVYPRSDSPLTRS